MVDLAALVSKWLGETEKNIAEVFDAAERSQAVLFFDEADAVFARRTDGSDAQGRWANLETAYLLARIDRCDGLVVLATNLRRTIDDAFLRRLDVIVEVEEPDRAARRAALAPAPAGRRPVRAGRRPAGPRRAVRDLRRPDPQRRPGRRRSPPRRPAGPSTSRH